MSFPVSVMVEPAVLLLVYVEARSTSVAPRLSARDVDTTSRGHSGSRVPSPRLIAQTTGLAHGQTASDGEREPGNIYRPSTARSQTQTCCRHKTAAKEPEGWIYFCV